MSVPLFFLGHPFWTAHRDHADPIFRSGLRFPPPVKTLHYQFSVNVRGLPLANRLLLFQGPDNGQRRPTASTTSFHPSACRANCLPVRSAAQPHTMARAEWQSRTSPNSRSAKFPPFQCLPTPVSNRRTEPISPGLRDLVHVPPTFRVSGCP
jgi:hypothetical protein